MSYHYSPAYNFHRQHGTNLTKNHYIRKGDSSDYFIPITILDYIESLETKIDYNNYIEVGSYYYKPISPWEIIFEENISKNNYNVNDSNCIYTKILHPTESLTSNKAFKYIALVAHSNCDYSTAYTTLKFKNFKIYGTENITINPYVDNIIGHIDNDKLYFGGGGAAGYSSAVINNYYKGGLGGGGGGFINKEHLSLNALSNTGGGGGGGRIQSNNINRIGGAGSHGLVILKSPIIISIEK